MFIKTNAAALCLIFALVSITYGVVACGVATSATVDGPGQSVAAMNGWLTTTKWVGLKQLHLQRQLVKVIFVIQQVDLLQLIYQQVLLER